MRINIKIDGTKLSNIMDIESMNYEEEGITVDLYDHRSNYFRLEIAGMSYTFNSAQFVKAIQMVMK